MNRIRMLVLGGVALGLSLVVTLIVYRTLQRRLNPQSGEMTQIVVASRKLNLGSTITESDVQSVPWSRAVPLEGSVTNPREVIGRGVVVPMLPNEPVLESKIAPKEAGAGLTPAIPKGMRAVAVKVNDVIGVAGFVLPMTKVDVIVTGSPDRDRSMEMSKVVLENIQVLAAGQNVEQTIDGKPQTVQVITLLVTPEQAQKLALASADSRIQLALRNPLDLEETSPEATPKAGLFQSTAAKLPQPKPAPKKVMAKKPEPQPAPVVAVAPPPPPPPLPVVLQVELIQGKARETFDFKIPVGLAAVK